MAILFKMWAGEWGGGGGRLRGQFPKKMVKITPNLAKCGKIMHHINASRRGELEDGA